MEEERFAATAVAAIAKAARDAGVRQDDLARAVGVSQSQMSKMLRGVRPFTVQQHVSACLHLGLDAAEALRAGTGNI